MTINNFKISSSFCLLLSHQGTHSIVTFCHFRFVLILATYDTSVSRSDTHLYCALPCENTRESAPKSGKNRQGRVNRTRARDFRDFPRSTEEKSVVVVVSATLFLTCYPRPSPSPSLRKPPTHTHFLATRRKNSCQKLLRIHPQAYRERERAPKSWRKLTKSVKVGGGARRCS